MKKFNGFIHAAIAFIAIMFITAIVLSGVGLMKEERNQKEKREKSKYIIVLPNHHSYFATTYEADSNGIYFKENEGGQWVEYHGNDFLIITQNR